MAIPAQAGDMSDGRLARIGRILAMIAIFAGIGSVAGHVINGRVPLFDPGNFLVHFAVAAVGFGAVAWIVLPAQPRNGMVWALLGSAGFAAVAAVGTLVLAAFAPADVTTANELLAYSPSELSTSAAIGAMLSGGTWVAMIFLAIGVGLLLFPDGRPPSPRWRWLVWLNTATILGITLGLTLASNPNSVTPIETSGEDFDGVAGAIVEWLFFPMVAGVALAIVSLIVRYRRSSGVARPQIQWIALGGLAFFVGAIAADPDVVLWPLLLGEVLLIAAFVIAISRYRLFDIDVIVSKSVTYLGLAAVITVLYAAVVVVPLLVIGQTDGEGPGLVLPIVATAVVAVLFEPIRSRMQRWANRLVYGERATPHQVLSQVTSQLAETTSENSTTDLAKLLVEGTGAERAVVWLRSEDVLSPEGMWPADDSVEAMPAADLVDTEFTESHPVTHGEEHFGALSITKPANDPITPTDRQLLSDVAAGAGLVLRNISLNRQLEDRADQLQESRRRLIAAQDAERHRLERDLHDGAQQQVVALKVKLGIAKTIAEREGADDLAAGLSALAEDTQGAVDSLRAVAHGIYPPLLEAEGLEAALRAVERSAADGLAIRTSDLGRYHRDVEATAYFFLVEATERARMSGSSFIQVDISDRRGELTFEIEHDGHTPAGELAAVADRIDVMGGRTVIEADADGLTRITNRIPTDLELV